MPRDTTRCCNCGEPLPDGNRYALPILAHEAYRIAPVDDTAQEWVGVPACRGCHDVHKASAGCTSTDAVMAAHADATEALRSKLAAARKALAAVAAAAEAASDVVGRE